MRYRRLGRTGIKVSEIGFGVYSVTGLYGELGRDRAIDLLRKSFDLGINLYDTADMYGFGLGETILREAFGNDLEDIVVATKVGYDFYSNKSGKPVRNFDPRYIEYAVRRSVERLGKKPIDILQIHNPTLEALSNPEIFNTLRRLVDEGLIEHVGVALGPETDVYREAVKASEYSEVETMQFVYNILEQEPGYSIASICMEKDIGILARVPHAGGILSGRLSLSDVDRLKDHRSLRDRKWYEWAFKVYSKVLDAIKGVEGTPGQIAVRFILDSINASSVIVIATSVDELAEYADSSRLKKLDNEVIDRLRRIYQDSVSEL